MPKIYFQSNYGAQERAIVNYRAFVTYTKGRKDGRGRPVSEFRDVKNLTPPRKNGHPKSRELEII